MPKRHPSQRRRARLQELPPDDMIDELNVRSRVCRVFQEDPKRTGRRSIENDKICKCGYPKSQHEQEVDDTKTNWSVLHNTLEQIDAAHGVMEDRSLFVRLDIYTPLEKVENILLEYWKIPKPGFIVSIVGGTKYFKLTDRLETNFINSIVEIAQKSNAWLLTNGYNNGIVQLVGQAINKVRCIRPDLTITAIGICKWGCITSMSSQTHSMNQNIEQVSTSGSSDGNQRLRRGQRELEINHTHYLMFDDGTMRDDANGSRTRLAIHMARLQHEDDITVPVVTIAVEGDQETLNSVYYDLRERIPVVVINGSGRVADFLNRWLLYTKYHDFRGYNSEIVYGIDERERSNHQPSDPTNSSGNIQNPRSSDSSHPVHLDYNRKKLREMLEKYSEQIEDDLKSILPEDQVNEDLIQKAMYCLQPAVRSDITVFNLNSESNLSETIFRCICRSRQKLNQRKQIERNEEIQLNEERFIRPKEFERDRKKSYLLVNEKAQRVERSRLLKLAMDWDCVDVAREFLFKNSLDNIINKNHIFRTALQQNRPMFVYEYLKLKIDLYEVFPPDKNPLNKFQYKSFIQTLYSKYFVNNGEHHLKSFMDDVNEHKNKTVDDVETLNRILVELIGDYMHPLYYDTLEEEQDDRHHKGLKQKPIKAITNKEKQEIMRTYFLRDVFLWAVLLNRADMAKVFLSFMDYRICPALIATRIFKEYHRKAPYGDLKRGYEKSMKDFEQYAIDCLGQCGNQNIDKACAIILQRNELYGYVTCLQVAYNANAKKFLSAECSVEAMKNVWYDKIDPDQNIITRTVSLFSGFLSLGLLAPIFVSYRSPNKEVSSNQLLHRQFESNGVNYCDPKLLKYAIPSSSHTYYKRYWKTFVQFHETSWYKLFNHFVTYLFFLLLFSYVLLFDFRPPTSQIPSIHWTEILTIILVTCMLIEEIHYFFHQDNLRWLGRIVNYFRKLFKIMTFFGFLLFYIGLIVRFRNANSEQHFVVARIIMAIDVEIWWLRLLSFATIIPLLGPHLVSIGKMLKDLLFFMCIIAVVMIGYGVASRSMTYYSPGNNVTIRGNYTVDTSFDGRSVFRQIIYPVYYLMYGEFGEELKNLDNNRDAGWSIATYILLAIHMMLVNILLINLLIALFSKRFEQVYDKTQEIWYSQTYVVTREYYMRAPLFPPFSLIYDVYTLIRMFLCYIQRKQDNPVSNYGMKVFQIIPRHNSSIMKEWREFEVNSTYEYAHNEVKNLKNKPTKPTTDTNTTATTKDIHEVIISTANTTNTAIDGLKQVEDDLLNINIVVNRRRSDMNKPNPPNQSNVTEVTSLSN